MALGGGDHPLEQAAVGLLGVDPATELGAGVAQPQRERVAGALELAEREDPRAADGADAELEALPGEGGRKELAELVFEAGDLVAKVAARAALGGGRNGLQPQFGTR